MPLYTSPTTSATAGLIWPSAIRTEHVQYLLANLASLGAKIEVGPSVGHPRNWNRLDLPGDVSYICHGCSTWWKRESTH